MRQVTPSTIIWITLSENIQKDIFYIFTDFIKSIVFTKRDVRHNIKKNPLLKLQEYQLYLTSHHK